MDHSRERPPASGSLLAGACAGLLHSRIGSFGYIACDSASNSEIVLPIHDGEKVVAVLDIDSPLVGRFSAEDEEGLKEIVKVLEKNCIWD